MKHNNGDVAAIKDALIHMSTRHPEIDAMIEAILCKKKKKMDVAAMRRLKDVTLMYCNREWKQGLRSPFFAFCMKEFYGTDKMFDESVKKEIASFQKQNAKPEQIEMCFAEPIIKNATRENHDTI